MTKPPSTAPLQLINREPDWTLLGRYLDGDCSPAEQKEVAAWVNIDPANARLLDFMRQLWAGAGVPRLDVDAGWRAMRDQMAACLDGQSGAGAGVGVATRPFEVSATHRSGPGHSVGVGAVVGVKSIWRRTGLAAAAAAAIVGGALLWRAYPSIGRAPAMATSGREYVTARGQRAQVTLVDGTRVWLNVDSRLRLLPGYGVSGRDVALEGEAYFVVEHDRRLPFRVLTRDAVSEDLGTEFGVRAYAEDPEMVLVVASGRVAMRRSRGGAAGAGTDDASGVELGRGQMARLSRTGLMRVTDNVNLDATFGWRNDRRDFTDRPLAELLRELERWYDLDIVLDDTALARTPVTFSLRGHTADQALGIVARIVDLDYVREGRQVRFTSKLVRH